MKNHFYFILLALIIIKFSVAADSPSEQNAPPPYQIEPKTGNDDKKIAVGSTVIPDDLGYSRKVVAINASGSRYLVKDYEGRNKWYPIERLGVTCGSLRGIYVGNTVIPLNFNSGHGIVVGINFTKSLYAVQVFNGSTIYWYSYDNLAMYEPPAPEKCNCSVQ